MEEARVDLLSMWHDQIKDLCPDCFLILAVALLPIMVVLDCEAHVILMHIGVLRDEVCVHLFLLGILEHHLDESLKVVRYLAVLAQ
jgi:hypothetical protein